MCECIKKINANLREQGQRLDVTVWTCVTEDHPDYNKKKLTVVIGAVKSKPSKIRLAKMVPVFCPFCGEKYEYDFIEHY